MCDPTMSAAGGGPAFSAAWEDWEGVLIELDNVSALGSSACVGSACNDPTLKKFKITGLGVAESSLAAFPDDANIQSGYCFTSITGVVSYFYDYLVYPRQASDVANNGTSCPAAESVCGDTIDNDGNGFTDCKDNGCVVNDNTCRMATTIAALDAAADANPAAPVVPFGVGLTGRCVTAVSGTSAYIADAGIAAADGGIFVFGGAPAGLVAGNTVDVIASTSLFKAKGSTAPNPLLELNGLQVTKTATPCTPVAAAPAMTAAQLVMDANGHKWIGSLVTLTSANGGQFKVTTANAGTFGKLTQGTTVFSFGNTYVSGFNATVNTCFDALTGIWTYDTFGSGTYEILPTVTPTVVTCN